MWVMCAFAWPQSISSAIASSQPRMVRIPQNFCVRGLHSPEAKVALNSASNVIASALFPKINETAAPLLVKVCILRLDISVRYIIICSFTCKSSHMSGTLGVIFCALMWSHDSVYNSPTPILTHPTMHTHLTIRIPPHPIPHHAGL